MRDRKRDGRQVRREPHARRGLRSRDDGGSRCILRGERAPTYCDGDVAVLCNDGWRMQTKDCAAEGKRCDEVLDEGSSTPHARCVE